MKGWELVTISGLSLAGGPHSIISLQHKVTSKGSLGPILDCPVSEDAEQKILHALPCVCSMAY